MIQAIEYIEFYITDLEKSAAALSRDFGFHLTGQQDFRPPSVPGGRSAVLRNGQITLLLTAPGTHEHPAARYVRQHGDGVAAIAFRTGDVRGAFEVAVAGGAEPIAEPAFAGHGEHRTGTAIVSGFGDVRHVLVERDTDAPSSAAPSSAGQADGDGLLVALDHVAVCLPAGQLDATVGFYGDVFGLKQVFDERIEVGGQAMLSKVVQDRTGSVTFTLIEPDPALKPGQIDEFLDAHGGAGVQHLAFRTDDITRAVRTLADRGVKFLTAPPGYYRTLLARLGTVGRPVSELEELNVLADRDRWGELFQIFTRSTHRRRTFFLELIERQGARTFGSRNIRALYEALGEEHTVTLPA
jgi:4-hydroxymandelate synthase